MTSDDDNALDLLSLPRPVLGLALRQLPLEQLLRTSTCCKLLNAIVTDEVLPHTQRLDLVQFPGAKTARALTWLCCTPSLQLKHLAMQGAVCQEAAECLIITDAGRRQLSTLHTLQLQSWKKLNNLRLELMLEHCASLQRLEFSDCKVDDAGLGAIALHTPQLQHLDCSHCRGVTDDGVAKLALGCLRLQSLVLVGVIHCTDQTPALLALHAHALQHLSMARCFKIGDPGIRALCQAPLAVSAGALGLSPAPRSLRSLDLSMCPRVATLEPLRALTQLEGLELTGCVLVQEQQLLAAVSGCCKSMKSLRLNNCLGLTGQGVVALAQACPALEVLCVRGTGVKDPDLQQLALHSRNLRELNINMCTAVTDEGLAPVLASNPGLERLEVEACYLLTDLSLRLLPRCTPLLSALNVRMCNCMSYYALLELVCGSSPGVPVQGGAPGGSVQGGVGPDQPLDAGTPAAGQQAQALSDAQNQLRPAPGSGSGGPQPRDEPPGGGSEQWRRGCVRLGTIHLGGVLSEAETTLLVRSMKAARPSIWLRV